MKAMVIESYGEDAEFCVADVDRPTAAAGQVLIRVEASSVNTVDTMIRTMGHELPFSPAEPAILGMDVAGVVAEVGADVEGLAVGDEVYGCAGGLGDRAGALAEFMVAEADLVAPKPKSLSMREAAALPLVAITAYEGLQRAGVREGQRVLVHGGTGGVGHVALQLAHHYGARVFATGGADPQLALIKELGATPINYRTEKVEDYVAAHTAGEGFELIYDSVGGANLARSFEAAALNASIATTVSLCDLDLTTAHFKGLSLHVVFMLIPMIHGVGGVAHGGILRDVARIVDAGALRPLIDEGSFGFSAVGEAYARLASGKAVGKVVLGQDLG